MTIPKWNVAIVCTKNIIIATILSFNILPKADESKLGRNMHTTLKPSTTKK
jgi:hypothetical protein